MSTATADPLRQLETRMGRAQCRDVPAFRRRLRGLRRRARAGKPYGRGLRSLEADLERSVAATERHAANPPRLSYPPELPVSARRADIVAALRDHQVVVLCGETGSGKTTQLPKLCIEAGCGQRGRVGQTQPRRIAARSVAARIAEELGTPVGAEAGYKVRFAERLDADAPIKVMTDGILLAETAADPELRQYDAIIVDEAHERSLNIDFLLGYLKRLLPRRPELRLIITSATIDPQRFARHFDDAPVLKVSGRTYPVEVRYRPPESGGAEADLQQAVVDALGELDGLAPGDVLVFLPGERDIRETSELLRRHIEDTTEVLPLYARLGSRAQQRIFEPGGRRRIVLATNIAETSVTVPGIRYVVDTGLARISRYSHRTRVQRLPIEPVSRASANQRKGRCGRLGPGVCIRLYSEEDYQSRPAFTDPEILRTNLASVILQMKLLDLGPVEDFPFVEPPERRYINDGLRLLRELGALDERGSLTEAGYRLARLPVDPTIGRMILAGAEQGALAEILVIASGLSIQDPRERPTDQADAADRAHATFADARSDFVSYLNLWRAYRERTPELSHNQLRRYCRERFLSHMRMREWRDVHQELWTLAREMGLHPGSENADYAPVHMALLAGLPGQIGRRSEGRQYQGPRGLSFHIHPSSALARRRPPWVVVAELVETSRLFGRCAARIEPAWVERVLPHLVARSRFEPHWDARSGRVVAYEQTSLHGLVLTARRRISYGRIDPAGAREIFIHEALVAGRYDSPAESIRANRELIAEIRELEARTRRPDLLVDAEQLFRLYDERIPAGIWSARAFESWRQEAERTDPDVLQLSREALMKQPATEVATGGFPDWIQVDGVRVALEYRFDPSEQADGVTARIPLAALNQLRPEPFEWLVPGMLAAKVAALIRSLPKARRRNFVPAPRFAEGCVACLPERSEEALAAAVARELQRMTGVSLQAGEFRKERIPDHLRMRFRVLDEEDGTLAEDIDLAALQARWGKAARQRFRESGSGEWERDDLRDWDFGPLPDHVDVEAGGVTVRAYPALEDTGQGVALRLFDSPEAAVEAMRPGILALLELQLRDKLRYLERSLPGIDRLCLLFAPFGSCRDLRRDIVQTAVRETCLADGIPRDEIAFHEAVEAGRRGVIPAATSLAQELGPVLETAHELAKRLRGTVPPAHMAAVADVRSQLDRLVYPGFVAATPPEWRPELARFLRAAASRLEKLGDHPARDEEARRRVAAWLTECERLGGDAGAAAEPGLRRLRWLIEELRVSLFAQELGTSVPVSDKRLRAAADTARRGEPRRQQAATDGTLY